MLTKEQLTERLNGIGGSEVASVLGIKGAYETPFQVWKRKVNREIQSESPKWLQRRSKVEHIIKEEYEEIMGLKMTKTDQLIRHPYYDYMTAILDGYNKEHNIVFESKTTRSSHNFGENGTSDIPKTYLCQVAHYANVCSPDRIDLAVWFLATDEFKIYQYYPDVKLQNLIIERISDFWINHVEKKIPPEPISLNDAKEIYKALSDTYIVANDTAKEFIEQLKDIKCEIKELEKKEEMLKLELLKYMKFSSALVDEFDNTLITNRAYKSLYFDVNKFKEEMPELYKKFSKERILTRFLVK